MPRGNTQRIASASLQGIAIRHVVGNGDQANTADALQAALASDAPSGPEVDAALAELRGRAKDRQAWLMAAAVFTDCTDPTDELALRLFELLGVDLNEARAYRAEHRGGGWRTPQAKAFGEE